MTRTLLAAVFATVAFATPAAASTGHTLPPEAAQAAADSPGHQDGPVVVRPASVGEAIAASHLPGAVTEGSLGSTSKRTFQSSLATCWNAAPAWTWGTWPYQQTVHDNTYWCGQPYQVTYRTTHVTLGAYLCSPSGAYAFKTTGGVGYSEVAIQAGGDFACPTTVPWVVLHYQRWMQDVYTWSGGAWINNVS